MTRQIPYLAALAASHMSTADKQVYEAEAEAFFVSQRRAPERSKLRGLMLNSLTSVQTQVMLPQADLLARLNGHVMQCYGRQGFYGDGWALGDYSFKLQEGVNLVQPRVALDAAFYLKLANSPVVRAAALAYDVARMSYTVALLAKRYSARYAMPTNDARFGAQVAALQRHLLRRVLARIDADQIDGLHYGPTAFEDDESADDGTLARCPLGWMVYEADLPLLNAPCSRQSPYFSALMFTFGTQRLRQGVALQGSLEPSHWERRKRAHVGTQHPAYTISETLLAREVNGAQAMQSLFSARFVLHATPTFLETWLSPLLIPGLRKYVEDGNVWLVSDRPCSPDAYAQAPAHQHVAPRAAYADASTYWHDDAPTRAARIAQGDRRKAALRRAVTRILADDLAAPTH